MTNALVGTGGLLKVGAATVADIRDWGIDIGVDFIDVTNFSSDGWKEFIAGLKEWTATASGNWNIAGDTAGQKAMQDAMLGGTTLAIEFHVDATHYYSGNAFVTCSPKQSVDGKAELSFNFKGTGALTYT